MTRASAKSTSSKRWSKDDFIRRTYYDQSLPRPPRFEPVKKKPGSFILTAEGIEEVERA
jgi:hypothetical protein